MGTSALNRVSASLVLLGMVLSVPLMADKPNVILVMSDDHGWTQTGYYGHPLLKTPNLDAMADEGFADGSVLCNRSACAHRPAPPY